MQVQWLSPVEAQSLDFLAGSPSEYLLDLISGHLEHSGLAVEGHYSAFLCAVDGLPIYLGIIRVATHDKVELIAFNSDSEDSSKDLEEALLRWLILELKQYGWVKLSATIPSSSEFREKLDRVASALGIELMRTDSYMIYHYNRLGGVRLLRRLARSFYLRFKSSERLSLQSLSFLDDAAVTGLCSHVSVPQWARPEEFLSANGELRLNRDLSFILLSHNRPSGWLIAHSFGNQVVRVSVLWLADGMRGSIAATGLLYTFVLESLTSGFKNCVFLVSTENAIMNRACANNLGYYACNSTPHAVYTLTLK